MYQNKNSVHNATSHVRGEIRSIHHLQVVCYPRSLVNLVITSECANDQVTVVSDSAFCS